MDFISSIKNEKSNGSKFGEMMNHKITALFISLFMIVIGIWFFSFSIFSDGVENRNKYYSTKDLVIPVSATVTEISVADSKYYIYIEYSYNGEKIEDKQWKTTDTKDYDIGDVVEIKINPEYPRSIFSEDDGTSDFITAGIMFSISSIIIIISVVYYLRKRRSCNE